MLKSTDTLNPTTFNIMEVGRAVAVMDIQALNLAEKAPRSRRRLKAFKYTDAVVRGVAALRQDRRGLLKETELLRPLEKEEKRRCGNRGYVYTEGEMRALVDAYILGGISPVLLEREKGRGGAPKSNLGRMGLAKVISRVRKRFKKKKKIKKLSSIEVNLDAVAAKDTDPAGQVPHLERLSSALERVRMPAESLVPWALVQSDRRKSSNDVIDTCLKFEQASKKIPRTSIRGISAPTARRRSRPSRKAPTRGS